MSNNIDLSPDSQVAFALSTLRGMEMNGPAHNGHHIVPGIFFSVDPESTNTVDVISQPGELLVARFNVDRPGRWLSLNLGIGGCDLTQCKIVGFACKSDAPATTTFQVCLRSGTPEGHVDAFFAKTVVAYPKTSLHLDVMETEGNPRIPAHAPWREIIIFFQREQSEVALRDFRVIII